MSQSTSRDVREASRIETIRHQREIKAARARERSFDPKTTARGLVALALGAGGAYFTCRTPSTNTSSSTPPPGKNELICLTALHTFFEGLITSGVGIYGTEHEREAVGDALLIQGLITDPAMTGAIWGIQQLNPDGEETLTSAEVSAAEPRSSIEQTRITIRNGFGNENTNNYRPTLNSRDKQSLPPARREVSAAGDNSEVGGDDEGGGGEGGGGGLVHPTPEI